MQERKRPTKEYVYPGGAHMCQSGKVRASKWASDIQTGQMTPEQLEELARKGEYSEKTGANTNKRNLIALTVFRHAKHGELADYTDEEGNFLDNGVQRNIHESKFKTLMKQLFGGGGDLE